MNTKLSAKELPVAYLENINTPDKVMELSADDATTQLL
jgi:hypothetical protein